MSQSVSTPSTPSNSSASTGGSSSGTNPSFPAGAAGPGAPFDDGLLVYRVDVVLIALVAVLVLLKIPRAFARLWRVSEWTNGHIFRYVPYHQSTWTGGPVPSRKGNSIATREAPTDESHTVFSHATNVRRTDEKGNSISMSLPPHIAAAGAFLSPLKIALRKRVIPGFSLAQFIVMVTYLGVLVFPFLYMSSGPFSDPVRSGWIAISQLPFVYMFATKNNVLGALLGVGYEKLNFLHRFVGRLVVIAVNIHALGYIYKWCIEEVFREEISKPKYLWGLGGLICLDCLAFFSTEYWRKNAYNIFFYTHIISFSVLFPCAWLHYPQLIPYLWACVGIYGLDHLLRAIKTRSSTAIVRTLPDLGVTRIEIPNINAGWRAGQHVRVRILSSRMGWLGWSEVHPFTIASHSGGNDGMVLMCKKVGWWTNKLYDLASSGGLSEAGMERHVKVMVEGPYGGPGHTMFASFSAAVFICGGSGITFALSTIQELIQKDQMGQSRVKTMELIWIIQDPAALSPLLPLFTLLIQQSVFAPLTISVYYTRAPVGKFPFSELFYPGLTLSPGRPRFTTALEGVLLRTINTEGKGSGHTGMIVGVCGPVGLADDVSKAVGRVEPSRRDQLGGIELHEETFGW